jgi:eukaryotic-like serine/threonine-protein kinase
VTGIPDHAPAGADPAGAEAAVPADPSPDQARPKPPPHAGPVADPDARQADMAADTTADPDARQPGAVADTDARQAGPGADPAADPDAGQAGIVADPVTDPDVRRARAAADPAADPAAGPPGEPPSLPNGHVLNRRYRLTGRIAAGGMGEVWRGTDELLGRAVAVKLLSDAHAADEQFRARFRAEARYAASLSHPGIARVYDYGESAAGPAGGGRPGTATAYLVMELVEGEPLSAALAREGRMSVDAALDIIAQAAWALAAAHEAGIVHRDVKPGNLLITPEGQVKITDFGIARAALSAHLTQSGMVMGTAQYVSPEQATARPITTVTDIYSLGVVGYECLAGQPPFTAETPIALALAHVHKPPPPLPDDVPAPVAALVGQMLAKEPSGRPASARLVADRASALRGKPLADENARTIGSARLTGPAAWFPEASPTSSGLRHTSTAPIPAVGPQRPRWRRPATLMITTGAVCAVVAAAVISLMAMNRHPATASTTVPTTSSAPPTHRVHRASHHASPQSSFSSQPTFAPSPTSSPAPSPRRPSPTPTTPTAPSSPTTPTSPGTTPPTSPSTTPPTTSPPASTSAPPPSGTGTVGHGRQAANTRTQDR